MARFDWYQGTVHAPDLPSLLGALEGAADGSAAWEPMERAPHGYGAGRRLRDGLGTVAQVWFGGCHEHPHVVASGDSAQPVSEVLRAAPWPHRVSRADACIDFAEPGAYRRLEGIALAVADAQRVKVGTAGDHLLRLQGRTLYLGAPSSHTRLRLYEKGDELRAKYRDQPDRLASVPEELARLECQVRPATPEAKMAAAAASPVELMGSTKWMRELMRQVSGAELEPFQAGKPWRQADDDRAHAALLAQYGALLLRRKEEHGSWAAYGAQVEYELAELARAKSRGR